MRDTPLGIPLFFLSRVPILSQSRHLNPMVSGKAGSAFTRMPFTMPFTGMYFHSYAFHSYFPRMLFTGIPFTHMPFTRMPFTRIPFTRMPFTRRTPFTTHMHFTPRVAATARGAQACEDGSGDGARLLLAPDAADLRVGTFPDTYRYTRTYPTLGYSTYRCVP